MIEIRMGKNTIQFMIHLLATHIMFLIQQKELMNWKQKWNY